MNKKEQAIWVIIDNVIKCCAITNPDGTPSITREDILGKSRIENLVMTRCMIVQQMLQAGFSITTVATILCRSPQEIRHLRKQAHYYTEASCVYRLAMIEAKALNKNIESIY